MKKVFAVVIAAVLMLSLIPAVALAHPKGIPTDLENGQHYNLNIIGVKYPKNIDTDETQANGHVIFVSLTGKSKIRLVEGDDYAVLDKNATDRDGALLQLPDPDLDPYVVGQDMEGVDTISAYSVFVRPLGKPGGWATITTCADVVASELANFLAPKIVKTILNDPAALGGWASVEQVGQEITLRTNGQDGKTKFTNVTAELLTIVLKVSLDTDGDGIADEIVYVRVPIFDDIIENEYWEYDNHNLKILQVRFYPIGTDVSAGDGDLPPLP